MKLKTGVLIMLISFLIGCESANDPGSSSSGGDDTSDGTTTDAGELSFDVFDAEGIVKINASSLNLSKTFDTSQPYKKVTAAGNIEDFIASGTISISDFYISPDGDLYLVLSNSTSYTPVSSTTSTAVSGCVLIKIVKADNSFECVDNTLTSVSTSFDPIIQFDDNNAIYYSGSAAGTSGGSSNSVLRRKETDGTITDYISQYMTIDNFVISGNGTAYLTGSTMTGGTTSSWFRKATPTEAGTVSTDELSDSSVNWMKEFPDGMLYIAATGIELSGYEGSFNGIFIMDGNAGTVTKCWIDLSITGPVPGAEGNGCSTSLNAGLVAADYVSGDTCGDVACSSLLTNLAQFDDFFQVVATPTNHVYSVANDPMGKQVWKLYPMIEKITFQNIEEVDIIDVSNGSLLVAGQDSDNDYRFFYYNITNEEETDLLPDEEIQIYHAKFSGYGRIWFDGFRFSDTKYVVGTVDTQLGNIVNYISSDYQIDELEVF